jgi:hypothetical protein
VEKTLELGAEDFLVEDTEPDPARVGEQLADRPQGATTVPAGTRADAAAPDPNRAPGTAGPVAGQQKSARRKRRRKRRGGKGRKQR